MATYFTVEGRGEFPFDMLRFDECWPVSSDDIAKMILRYGIDVDDERIYQRRKISMASNKPEWHAPTYNRWESFNWRVVEVAREAQGETG